MIKIRVPATSANLGPGFDCLGLALDLWNDISIESADKLEYQVTGEGAEKLNKGTKNLLTKAFALAFETCGKKLEPVRICAHNEILLSSGMGSSAAAIVGGLFGANEFLGQPLDTRKLLNLASEMEGHPDNVAPALLGGLVASTTVDGEIISERFEVPEFTMVVVKPELDWPTRVARSVLPKSVSRTDAVFNISRSVLVVEALKSGNLPLLQKVMDDRIHQPYRLRHIKGGLNAYKLARTAGAAALSGAGPSIITFVREEAAEELRDELIGCFLKDGISARGIITKPSILGAHRI